LKHEQTRYKKNLRESESQLNNKSYLRFIDALNNDIKVSLAKGIQTWKNENPSKGYARCSPNQMGIFWNNAHPKPQEFFQLIKKNKNELSREDDLWDANPHWKLRYIGDMMSQPVRNIPYIPRLPYDQISPEIRKLWVARPMQEQIATLKRFHKADKEVTQWLVDIGWDKNELGDSRAFFKDFSQKEIQEGMKILEEYCDAYETMRHLDIPSSQKEFDTVVQEWNSILPSLHFNYLRDRIYLVLSAIQSKVDVSKLDKTRKRLETLGNRESYGPIDDPYLNYLEDIMAYYYIFKLPYSEDGCTELD